MALRKSKAASRGRTSKATTPVSVADLPTTRGMLGQVRTELIERIEQSKSELRGEIGRVHAEVQELKAGQHRLEHRLEAGLHEVKAEVARVAFLVEEQNARNRVVMDALSAFIDRQDRLEERMDGVEQTVRSLASPPPAA